MFENIKLVHTNERFRTSSPTWILHDLNRMIVYLLKMQIFWNSWNFCFIVNSFISYIDITELTEYLIPFLSLRRSDLSICVAIVFQVAFGRIQKEIYISSTICSNHVKINTIFSFKSHIYSFYELQRTTFLGKLRTTCTSNAKRCSETLDSECVYI